MTDEGYRFEVWYSKCGVLAMKRGKEVECSGIELQNGEEIGQIGEEGGKHLDVFGKRDI